MNAVEQKGRLMDASAIAAVVYVIDADQGVKIGITKFADVRGRQRDLERAAGQPFRVIRTWPFSRFADAFNVERCAHRLLAADRTIGEWFQTHPLEACAVIDRLVKDGNASALLVRMAA